MYFATMTLRGLSNQMFVLKKNTLMVCNLGLFSRIQSQLHLMGFPRPLLLTLILTSLYNPCMQLQGVHMYLVSVYTPLALFLTRVIFFDDRNEINV